MLGAIAGDIIGSIYEANPIKTKDFPLFGRNCRFTDDTVLTVAIADAILHHRDYADTLKDYYRRYPQAGYGMSFAQWGASDGTEPYNSWGNGSAMRVSPVGFAYPDLETVLQEAQRSAAVTHNHPEGIKGAQATAACIFLARQKRSQTEIQTYVESTFGYDLSQPLERLRPTYTFDVSCQGSVPAAIRAFLESTSFEDAVRNAVSLGGDSDTQACITGAIAHAFYGGTSKAIAQSTLERLDQPLREMAIAFMARHNIPA